MVTTLVGRLLHVTRGRVFTLIRAVTVVLVALCIGADREAAGQCTEGWLPGERLPDVDGEVWAMAWWDPDGPGPRSRLLVLGGRFSWAGNVRASNIVTFDPATREWSAMDAGMLFYVNALIPTPAGELIAGGSFLRAGDTNAAHVARWNGSEWSPMGSGVGGPGSSSDAVLSLALLPNGDVVAAGLFTQAGGTPVGHIARWNGSAWLPLGGGVSGSALTFVMSLEVLPDGRLVAGGSFTSAGGVPASNIAIWDGSNWSACGSGLNGEVGDIAITPEGGVLAGGAFTSAGGVQAERVAVWSGSSWSAVGAGLQGYVRSVLVLPGGKYIAGGYYLRSNDDRCEGLAQWDGARWTPVGGGFSCAPQSLVNADSDGFLVGGGIPWAAGAPTERVAWWDGTGWLALNDGFGGGSEPSVRALSAFDDGSVVVGGRFTSAGGTPANSIARWSTSGWEAMGSGVEGGTVYALATLADGGIVAGGTFTAAGGVPVNRIARWDGDRWLPLGSGFEGPDARVHALAALPDGDLIACGYFTSAGGVSAQHIARWDGVHWNPLGEGVAYSHRLSEASIAAVVVLPDGSLVVAGSFDVAGGVPASGVARWDGAAWHPLGGGPPWASRSLAVLADGSILAGRSSSLSLQPAVYRWDGVQWSPFGTELFTEFSNVHAIVPMANGEVLIAGILQLIGSLSDRILRWNGTQWMPLGTGLGGGGGGRAWALALLANGDIAVGGEFITAGGAVSARFARYSFGTDCCDPVDFNGDELFPDTQDIADFLLVFGGGACPTTACGDIDFNNDGLFPDTLDIQALLSVFSGGECVQ